MVNIVDFTLSVRFEFLHFFLISEVFQKPLIYLKFYFISKKSYNLNLTLKVKSIILKKLKIQSFLN